MAGDQDVQADDGTSATALERGGQEGIAHKARKELIEKGVALQSVLMGSINNLQQAHTACLADESGVRYVDRAWAMFASDKGPIALGEKRCPQFDTCLSDTGSTLSNAAGESTVNAKILAGFIAAQAAATAGDCAALLTQIDEEIIPQMFVPILQGLFREAWEVDITLAGVHSGADGFIEDVEGWAFASAVLPRIDNCSTTAAATVVSEPPPSPPAPACAPG